MVASSRTQLEDLWNRALSSLRERLDHDEFDSWIRPLVPLSLSSETLELSVPNKLFASWLEENYLELIAKAWVDAHGHDQTGDGRCEEMGWALHAPGVPWAAPAPPTHPRGCGWSAD